MKKREIFFKKYLKKPCKIFFTTFLIGIIFGMCLSMTSEITTINPIKIGDWDTFKEIFVKNASIIFTIYISIALTDKYSMFVYGLNGTLLGISVGRILCTNVRLLLLLVPHGIFEIPCILATGWIVHQGEGFIRSNFKKYLILMLIHIIAIGICALIEAFITPLFQCFI